MFGAPPAGGGFGKAAPPAGGGFGAAPAAGGFGKAPAAAGGFGAPAAPAAGGGGFGGFGKAPAAAGGFGSAPAAGGFGSAPAAGGFGSAPAAGGFGSAPAAGGFGGGGFGAGAPTAAAAPQTGLGVGGFGSAPPPAAPTAAAGGFGGGGGFGAAQPAAAPAVALSAPQDPTRQSTIVRYIMEIDSAFNALHANCKFRTFLYNMCTPGLGDQAIARERYAAANAGGGCREEDWVVAQRNNPDPEHMYPHPVHFFQGLKQRADKQVEMMATYHKHLDQIVEQVGTLEDLHEDNTTQHQKLQVEHTMLERRWLAVATKVEAMRQLGLPLGSDEKAELFERTHRMMSDLRAPGIFQSASAEFDNLLDMEASRASRRAERRNQQAASSSSNASRDRNQQGGILKSGAAGADAPPVEPHVLKDWKRFLERLQEGLESLKRVVDRDTKDARAAKRFLITNRAS